MSSPNSSRGSTGGGGWGTRAEGLSLGLSVFCGFGAATFAAAIIPTVVIGMNWKRATPLAAKTALAASVACNLGFEILDLRLPYGIQAGFAALVVSLLLFLGISLASSPPRLPPDVEAVLDA